jgi:uncharacterized protein YjbI with pentapeptide repeats
MSHTARTTTVRSKPKIDLHGAYVPRTSLRNAILTFADLSEANATNVDFRGADLTGAKLVGTILHGADLRDVSGLTVQQLKSAILDENTKLPDYIDRTQLGT